VKLRFYRARWFQVLLVGAVFFAITIVILNLTNNINILPTVILVGSFTVPVTFVIYFYEHVKDRDISLVLLSSCFIVGGVIGLAAAGTIESQTLPNSPSLPISGYLTIGFIEETVKLIFPVAMFIMWRYRHEADGLLFGVAAGMGFAALETMGYSLVSLIQSGGDLVVLQQVIVARGVLSPAGHAAWTGLVCAQLWKERQVHNRIFSIKILGAYLLAIALHSSWDIVSSLNAPPVLVIAGLFTVVIVSLVLLISRYRDARKLVLSQTMKDTGVT
jgi:protease PrsW